MFFNAKILIESQLIVLSGEIGVFVCSYLGIPEGVEIEQVETAKKDLLCFNFTAEISKVMVEVKLRDANIFNGSLKALLSQAELIDREYDRLVLQQLESLNKKSAS